RPVISSLAAGSSFFHLTSGYKFVVEAAPENKAPLTISYSRGSSAGSIAPIWFIGSGHVGRSFVFSKNGHLYMSPVSYYASNARWDLSPGYQRYTTLYATRPVTEPCWNCHSSGTRKIAGTVNRYDDPPFEEAGVACARCHGPGAEHARSARRADVWNPAKMPNRQREDLCAQCHFTGAMRIERPSRSLRDFEPGDRLSDYV